MTYTGESVLTGLFNSHANTGHFNVSVVNITPCSTFCPRILHVKMVDTFSYTVKSQMYTKVHLLYIFKLDLEILMCHLLR
jgi:hypothetical protein